MSDEKSVLNEVQQLGSFALCVPPSHTGRRDRFLKVEGERVVVEPPLYALQVIRAVGQWESGLDQLGQDVRKRLLLTRLQRSGLGLNALTTWLREQLSDDAARPSAQRSRRLESDAAAVQLATIHASKGLQFPIVYAPFLADRFDPTTGSVERDGSRSTFLRYHDERGQRVIDVRDEPDVDVLAQARVEDDGESLRLLYVALTRAQSQLVTWWAPSTNAASAPLHRALLGRSPGGIGTPEATVRVPSKRVVVDRLDAWRLAGGPQPEWMDATAVALPTPAETPGPPDRLR